jgi:crotonobetainyl-CoA:carnitine CoA-transferase CaiB-like acyl-CoA transferase
MLTPHRRPYPTKDGFISVIASSDAQYARLLTALGRPELIDDPRFNTMAARAQNVDFVLSVLTDGLRARGTAEWLEILTEADIPCGNANRLADLFADDYLRDTGFFQAADHPTEGPVMLPAFPATFSAAPPSVRRLWPGLGEHTREVLREVGLNDAEISAIDNAQAP